MSNTLLPFCLLHMITSLVSLKRGSLTLNHHTSPCLILNEHWHWLYCQVIIKTQVSFWGVSLFTTKIPFSISLLIQFCIWHILDDWYILEQNMIIILSFSQVLIICREMHFFFIRIWPHSKPLLKVLFLIPNKVFLKKIVQKISCSSENQSVIICVSLVCVFYLS